MDPDKIKEYLLKEVRSSILDLNLVFKPYFEAGFHFKPIFYEYSGVVVRYDRGEKSVMVFYSGRPLDPATATNETLLMAVLTLRRAADEWGERKQTIDSVLAYMDE